MALSGAAQSLGREASSDLVITAPFVSRRHAWVEWRGGVPVLVDNGSTYGLMVRGERVKECSLPATEEVQIVGPGPSDIVRLKYLPAAAPQVRASPSGGQETTLRGQPSGQLRLPDVSAHISIGREVENDIVLDHPQVSRRHAAVQIRSGVATLQDHSTNGTFVNGVRVDRQRGLKAGDRIRICCYEIEFNGRELVQYDQSRRARIDALRLSRVVGKGTSILNDVTFSVLPNEMVAIVGTSGAGKSTLMDALNGFRPATSGSVLVNGRDYYREFAAMRLLVGYVPQMDVVHRDLPAERALAYAAHLRLPADTDAAERAARVSAVLGEVGLTDRRNIQISQLSGGQIKRVSIGVELLTRPSLFFLDEPTSGLDPGYEKRMMELLRSLAGQGRTIVLITHATQSIELCDYVAFMAPGGYLAFFGPPRAALEYFECSDYPGIYTRIEREEDGAALAARFHAHPSYDHYVRARTPGGAVTEIQPYEQASEALPGQAPVPARMQLRILVLRYAEILARDRRNLLLLLLQAPVIAFLAALIAKPETFTALPDASGSRTLLVILSCSIIWLAAMNAAREIVKELPIYRRERMVGLGLLPYLASKYVVLGTFCVLQALVLLAGIGLRTSLPDKGVMLPGGVELYITLVLAAGASLAMGLTISTLFNNADRATALVPYLLIPQIIFVVASVEGPTRVIASLTISRWTLQALGATVDLPRFAAGLQGLDAAEFTHSAGFLLSRWAILLVMAGAFTVASFYFLKRHDGDLMWRRAGPRQASAEERH
ncbi:MAG: FHA domain-containing protein [Chloroflexota bacterium]